MSWMHAQDGWRDDRWDVADFDIDLDSPSDGESDEDREARHDADMEVE